MSQDSVTVAIVGAGAIGGVTAAFMTKAGWDPEVVCKHKETVQLARDRGIHVFGVRGDQLVRVNAVESIADLAGQKNVVLLATKATDVVDAAKELLPFLYKDSAVVTMQNGICEEAVAQVVGPHRVIGCVVVWGATLRSPAEIEMTSTGEFVIGSLHSPSNKWLAVVKDMLSSVFPARISDNIRGELYSKLIINSCINSLGAITGAPLGELLRVRKVRNIFMGLMREMMSVAEAMKIKVAPGSGGRLDYYRLLEDRGLLADLKRHLALRIAGLKFRKIRSSSLQSLERGRKTEIDYLNGYICERGREYGVPTPMNDVVVAMVKEIEAGSRKITLDNLRDAAFERL